MLRHQSHPGGTLTRTEVRGLISACSRRAPTGIRNRALIATLYRAGLRLSEAINLRPEDLDIESGEGVTQEWNGHAARPFALDEGALELVVRWKQVRANLARARGFNAAEAPLFCTLSGGELSPRYVQAALKRLGEKGGIDKRVTPRGLRHAFAAELAKEGIPMDAIQAALGHESLETTERYLTRLTQPSVRSLVSRSSWTALGSGRELDDEAMLLINLLARRGITAEKLVEALSRAS